MILQMVGVSTGQFLQRFFGDGHESDSMFGLTKQEIECEIREQGGLSWAHQKRRKVVNLPTRR